MAHGVRRRVARDGSVRWQVRFEKVDPSSGKRVETSRTFGTKREALAFKSEIDRDRLLDGKGAFNPLAGRTTVSEVWERFAYSKMPAVSAKTWHNYRQHWMRRIEPRWGGVAVQDIARADIEAWIGTLDVGAWTISGTVVLLRQVLDMAVKEGCLRRSPAEYIRTPPVPPRDRHRYLTPREVDALVLELGGEGSLGGDVALTLAYTGLRWSELVGLRKQDVDLWRRRLYVRRAAPDVGGTLVVGSPKTRAGRREVPLTKRVAAVIGRRIQGCGVDGLVFRSPQGGMLRVTNWRRHTGWNDAIKRAGVAPLTLHELRHTYASVARAAGADLKMIQTTMGHSSVVITANVYSDLFDDELSSVAEKLDLLDRSSEGTGQVPDTTTGND